MNVLEWLLMVRYFPFPENMIPLVSLIVSWIGMRSLIDCDRTIYSASIVLRAICVCSVDTQSKGHPSMKVMRYPVLGFTQMGS